MPSIEHDSDKNVCSSSVDVLLLVWAGQWSQCPNDEVWIEKYMQGFLWTIIYADKTIRNK